MAVAQLELRPPGPFRLDLTVWALRRRAHNAVDSWDGTWYRRTVVLGQQPVEVAVGQVSGADRPRLTVELRSAGPAPSAAVTAAAQRLLECMLSLHADLAGFYSLAEGDPRLAPLAHRFVGMRPPRFPSVFEAVVNAVACQQLSLVVGVHLLNRLAGRFGPVVPGLDGPAGFPIPSALAAARPEDLRALGFSRAKARTVINLARAVASKEVDLESLEAADDHSALEALMELPGIGRWSAEYTLLRGLGRWHVLPGDDVGARNNLRRRFGLAPDAGYAEVSELSRSWWPYGGLVYFHLLLDSLANAGQLVQPAGPVFAENDK
jgi:DNA-3-methyladenine glycosylase II